MNLTFESHPGFTLVKTEGYIDESAREAFRDSLHPIVGERNARLIIDLSGSTRINSPGLGHLITLVVHANTNSSRVILCCVPPFLSMVFETSKLNTYFSISKTLDEAVASLSDKQPT